MFLPGLLYGTAPGEGGRTAQALLSALSLAMLAIAARGGAVAVAAAGLAGTHLATVGLLAAIPSFGPGLPGVLVLLGEVPRAKALACVGLAFLASIALGQIPAAAAAMSAVPERFVARIARWPAYLAGVVAVAVGFAGALGILGEIARSVGYIERGFSLGTLGPALRSALGACEGGRPVLYLLLLDGGLVVCALACLAHGPGGRRRGAGPRGA